MLGRLVSALRTPRTASAAAAAASAVALGASISHESPSYSEPLWAPDGWFSIQANPAPALSPFEWRALKVWSVTPQSPNTKLIRFVFDDPHAACGMEVASYLLARAFIGKEKPDGSRGVVIRPYTPSHTTIGYLELVIKEYSDGKMSKHIHSLKPGDRLEFKGPVMGTPIIQNEFESIGLIAGGTGITPMLQVAQRILENPSDSTKVSLIFANVTESDIILREKIDELQRAHPKQFDVYYVLDRPPPGWHGGSGYISEQMLRDRLPPPQLEHLTKVLLLIPSLTRPTPALLLPRCLSTCRTLTLTRTASTLSPESQPPASPRCSSVGRRRWCATWRATCRPRARVAAKASCATRSSAHSGTPRLKSSSSELCMPTAMACRAAVRKLQDALPTSSTVRLK